MARTPPRTAELVRLLTALADPVRIEILGHLARRPDLSVAELAARFPLTRPAISHHLRVLREAGILSRERRGQRGIHAVRGERVGAMLRALADGLEAVPRRAGPRPGAASGGATRAAPARSRPASRR